MTKKLYEIIFEQVSNLDLRIKNDIIKADCLLQKVRGLL